MCNTCGCNQYDENNSVSGELKEGHNHSHTHTHDISFNVMTYNNKFALENREFFTKNAIKALNLLSSPGSGKTTLLVRTIEELKEQISLAVIEGDQETEIDALKIQKTGIKALQINTGKACHLDAHGIAHAVRDLDLDKNSILFIENVGNLICPTAFDLGESERVVILSATEGEEKPLKYPHIFASADVVIISKIDAADFLGFNIPLCEENIRKINKKALIFRLSAKTGEGMEKWLSWLSEDKQLENKEEY